jgi:hypothetical protein
MADVDRDLFLDFKTDDLNVGIPLDANEFCAEDLARVVLGFLDGKVRIVDIVECFCGTCSSRSLSLPTGTPQRTRFMALL